ncbi:hypothetical protein FACS1894176_04400 [Bacteroidia bacterium]|nr:hypothetical protein FACS1894176_04400 [Bacteroidia bacterium]
MRYGAITSNYFKSYYLAKAGLELAITETAIRDAGFTSTVKTGSAIVSGNVFSDRKGFEPDFEVTSTVMTGEYCRELKLNESIVIPLFLDDKNTTHKDALTSPGKGITPFPKNKVEKIATTLTPPNNNTFFGIFAYSGEEMIGMISKIRNSFSILKAVGDEWNSIFKDESNTNIRRYVTILNNGATEEVCIQ